MFVVPRPRMLVERVQFALWGRSHLGSARRGELVYPSINVATYEGRAFAYAGPTTWNSLPDSLKDTDISFPTFTRLSLSTSTLKRVRGASQKRATSLLLCYVMSVIATKRFQSSRDLSALYKSVLIDRLTQLPGHLFYGQHLGNKSSDCRLAAAVLAVTVAPRLEESISETWHSATPSPSGGRPSQTAACQRSRRSESLFGSLLRCTERDTTAIIDRNEADRRRMHD